LRVWNNWLVSVDATPVEAQSELCLYKQTEYRYVQLLLSVELASAKVMIIAFDERELNAVTTGAEGVLVRVVAVIELE